jgi:UDP-N-acetylmuramoyl-L-alanyl-D-glutamate--2,6-diaminopimelate ligase
MKNEDLIANILPYVLSGDISALRTIKSLDWRIEYSNPNTAIAYQLNDGEAAFEKLHHRLEKFKPGVLILNREPTCETGVPTLVIKNGVWHKCLFELCQLFYPHSNKLKIIAITGTNGKTTTADLVLQLAEQAGLKGFSIGTLGVRQKGTTLEEFGLTTPGQIQLHYLLHKYGTSADFVVMEASSHALQQERVFGLEFISAAWTSFTQDHLDYHRSMDEYFAAKCLIVKSLRANGTLFVPEGQVELREKLKDFKQLQICKGINVSERNKLSLFFRTRFNEENLVCAISLVEKLGILREELKLDKLNPPPGRFYIREWNKKTAVVDFAHTPDALENVLKTLHQLKQGRLIVVFGCGGDRDRSKRPLMAEAAERYGNEIILTTDNPRTEDPLAIIKDVEKGFQKKSFSSICDREEAIREAIQRAQPGDIVVIAGKGHENYQEVHGVKTAFDDVAVAQHLLRTRV